ncbi:uncharacterized protein DFL_006571 [Arthrobotrys flagrans]|uniref:Uncharacterized protein n=1 Tax=Arthrobotrys flagrans TaxID=97331 RepID=A0A436ZT60_ARTFL|nr:hypothetical protein DFL_006571 [Arthrobotrys flagrans]
MMAQPSVVLTMDIRGETFSATLKGSRDSGDGIIAKASVETIDGTESVADSCGAYRGSNKGFEFESNSFHDLRPGCRVFEKESVDRMLRKAAVSSPDRHPKFIPCGFPKHYQLLDIEDTSKLRKDTYPVVSVPLQTWFKEKECLGPKFETSGPPAGGGKADLDSLSPSPGDTGEVVEADEGMFQPDKNTTSTSRVTEPPTLQTSFSQGGKEMIEEEESNKLTPSLIFLTELPNRFACPFAKINPTSYRSCLAVNRRNVSGIREHLEKRHGLQNLPSFDDGVDSLSHWGELFAAVLSYSEGKDIYDKYPAPYFDFDELLQDSSDLRGKKQTRVTTDNEDFLTLHLDDRRYNLPKISSGDNTCAEASIASGYPGYSADIPEEFSTLWVLDYLSAVLVSVEVARRWLEAENRYLASYTPTQLEVNIGNFFGTSDHRNQRSQVSNSSRGAEESSKKSRSRLSEKKKRSRKVRYNDGKEDEDNDETPPKRNSQGRRPRYLKKVWRCPYSIIQCENHKKCWESHEISRQTVPGIREHLKRAHFNGNLPNHLSAEFAPSWQDLFERCLQEPCHSSWLSPSFHATWYRYLDESNSSSNPPKFYTPQQAKALVAAGYASIDDPELFSCSSANGVDVLEEAAAEIDDVTEPEHYSTKPFDEGIDGQSNISHVEESISFGDLKLAPNIQVPLVPHPCMSRYDSEQQAEYNHSILARYWYTPQETGPWNNSITQPEAVGAIESRANNITPQPVESSPIFGDSVVRCQTIQLQNPAFTLPPKFVETFTNISHKSNENNLRDGILAPKADSMEVVVKIRHRQVLATEVGVEARILKFQSLDELRLEFVDRIQKRFYGSTFSWGNPRWQLQEFKTGAIIACIQDLEKEVNGGNNVFYLIDSNHAVVSNEWDSGPSISGPFISGPSGSGS